MSVFVDTLPTDFTWSRPVTAQCWCHHPAVIQRQTLDGRVTSAYCRPHFALWWRRQYGSPVPPLSTLLGEEGV